MIKNIVLRKVPNPTGTLLAYARVTFDNDIFVDNIAIRNGSKGVFVGWPSEKGSDGRWHEISGCYSREFKDEIGAAILDKFDAGDFDSHDAIDKAAGKKPWTGKTNGQAGSQGRSSNGQKLGGNTSASYRVVNKQSDAQQSNKDGDDPF